MDYPKNLELPSSVEAEQALLGALLRDNRHYEDISSFLRPWHFFYQKHTKIYELIAEFLEKGLEARPSNLSSYLSSDPLFENDGVNYVFSLVSALITKINIKDHAKIIYDFYLKRELILLGEDITQKAYSLENIFDAKAQINEAENLLFRLAESGAITENSLVSLADSCTSAIAVIENAYKSDSHVIGVDIGLDEINHMLGGLHPSDLIILAGRPAMGKTALAVTMAYLSATKYAENPKSHGGRVLFFSLEMSASQLAARIISQKSGVSGDRMRRGQIDDKEFNRITQAAFSVSSIPFYIDDTPSLSVGVLRQRARRHKRQMGLDMIVIDYLQLLQLDDKVNESDGRVQIVSEITRQLKSLAKELSVPVLCLSQLSRQVEHREDKRPLLSDLRESGSIEQDADVVCFVYRPEYYLRHTLLEQGASESQEKFHNRVEKQRLMIEEKRNLAEFIIAKQRHGPVGTVELFFNSELTSFENIPLESVRS